MGFSIRTTRIARAQVEEAANWWRSHGQAAPNLLENELEHAFILLSAHPKSGSPCLDTEFRGVRRLHLERVRYHLYYRVRSGGAVEIVALWHTSRGSLPSL